MDSFQISGSKFLGKYRSALGKGLCPCTPSENLLSFPNLSTIFSLSLRFARRYEQQYHFGWWGDSRDHTRPVCTRQALS
jgi:hypothetical protein